MINALLGSFGRFVAFSQILFVLPLSLDVRDGGLGSTRARRADAGCRPLTQVMGKECFLALSAVSRGSRGVTMRMLTDRGQALSLYYATAATAYLIVRNTRYNFIQQVVCPPPCFCSRY